MFGVRALEWYRDRARRFGPTFAALEYSIRASQTCRFDAVTRLLQVAGWPAEGLSILDVGSGHGDFLAYLHERRLPVRRYLGVDIAPEMVEHARLRQPLAEFRCGTAFDLGVEEPFDAAVAIGIFTVREASPAVNRELVIGTMQRLFALSRRVACITVLSNRKASIREDEYVADPWDLARELQELVSERVIVDHQELPHAAAIAAYHGASHWKRSYDAAAPGRAGD